MGFDIEKQIKEALSQYAADVESLVEEEIDNISDEAIEKLEENSPERRPRYKKGWKKTINKKGGRVLYNEEYRLTHLLEKGHANRDGGRTAPIVHISPVEKFVIDETQKRIESRLGDMN